MHHVSLSWGPRLKAARMAAGLSQATVAQECGVHQQQVSKWERGVAAPRDRSRILLAKLLGSRVADLFPYDVDTEVA